MSQVHLVPRRAFAAALAAFALLALLQLPPACAAPAARTAPAVLSCDSLGVPAAPSVTTTWPLEQVATPADSAPAGATPAPACGLQLASQASPRPFTGFCHCSGTFKPDCNTSADCLGSACLKVPTFC